MALMPGINYADEFTKQVQELYPFKAVFGKLYSNANTNKYRFLNSNTIEVPTISSSGRTDSDRSGNYDAGTYANNWTQYTLDHERQWNIPLHPRDVEETNGVTALENILKDHVNQHVIPEKDRYTVSKIYSDWTTKHSKTPIETALTTANVLSIIDDMSMAMDKERIPVSGRVLYVTHEVNRLIKYADEIQMTRDVIANGTSVTRGVSRLDELEIVVVSADEMQTEYDFTIGSKTVSSAKQINMFMIHPDCLITPATYDFAGYSAPKPETFGVGKYFEEEHMDVFILPYGEKSIQFHATAKA